MGTVFHESDSLKTVKKNNELRRPLKVWAGTTLEDIQFQNVSLALGDLETRRSFGGWNTGTRLAVWLFQVFGRSQNGRGDPLKIFGE